MTVVNPLGFLNGAWRVNRRIKDYRTGVSGLFSGVATVTEKDLVDALFHEAGELDLGTFQGQSERTLIYRQREGTAVQIVFEDGSPFIDIDFNETLTHATHFCGKDQYQVSFRVVSDDLIEERWRVRGPMKDYEAIATWTREPRLETD